MGILPPLIVSEFETKERSASYEAWFKAKVQAALDDPRPGVPHDELMAEMDAIICEAEARMNKQG